MSPRASQSGRATVAPATRESNTQPTALPTSLSNAVTPSTPTQADGIAVIDTSSLESTLAHRERVYQNAGLLVVGVSAAHHGRPAALLVRSRRLSSEADSVYMVPAGVRDDSDASSAHTAVREFIEEVFGGVQVIPTGPLKGCDAPAVVARARRAATCSRGPGRRRRLMRPWRGGRLRRAFTAANV